MVSTGQSQTTEVPGWVTRVLSEERFRTYLIAAGNDSERALDLHRWNIRISQMLLGDLWLLELGLRNALAPRLQGIADKRGLGPWYLSPAVEMLFPGDAQARSRDTVTEAARRAGGRGCLPGGVVAELSLGFWVGLFHRRNRGTLWDGGLKSAFPHGTNPSLMLNSLQQLNKARNRMSHLEPMLKESCTVLHRRAVGIAKLIDPDFADYMVAHSMVERVDRARP